MSNHANPYTVQKVETLKFPLLSHRIRYEVLYEEDTSVFQTASETNAHDVCEAMNMAHRAGWYDARAMFENTI